MRVSKGERKDFLGRRLSTYAGNQTITQSRADDVPFRRVVCSQQALQAKGKEFHMKPATISTELNAAGSDVDRAIVEFLKQQSAKQEGQLCVPSLALIALAVLQQTGRKTSPYIVRLRLKELGAEEEVDTAVEARKREHRPHRPPQLV